MDNLLSLERFNDALEKKGWTMKQLAAEYDRTYPNKNGKTIYNTLRKWNGGNGNPTLEKLVRICDLLECDIDYLIGRMDEHTHTNQFIHDQTGLSEDAIETLHTFAERAEREDDEWVLALDFLLRSENFDTLVLLFYDIAFCSFTQVYADLMSEKDDSNLLAAVSHDWRQKRYTIEWQLNKTFVHITDDIQKEAAGHAKHAFSTTSGSSTFEGSVEITKHQSGRVFWGDDDA